MRARVVAQFFIMIVLTEEPYALLSWRILVRLRCFGGFSIFSNFSKTVAVVNDIEDTVVSSKVVPQQRKSARDIANCYYG